MASFPEDPINVYQQGQRVTMFADFKDASGTAADPDVVLLRYIEGDGSIVDVLAVSLENPNVGRWEYGLTLPQDGDKAAKPWVYRFEASSVLASGVNAADEKRFEVDPSPFYPPA